MVFTTVYIIARAVAFSNKNIQMKKKSFLERESEANSVRRADISKLPYISIPFDSLTIKQPLSKKNADLMNKLNALHDRKILDLSAYTNTELKLMYGPANLEELSACDANYTTLIRLLDSIGNNLINESDETSGVKFLEYAIDIGSDITNTYMTLSDIYVKRHDTAGLQKLLDQADEIHSLTGPNIKAKLDDKLHSI